MKRILLLFVGLLFLFSCELTINEDISTQYLVDGMTNGDLDIYLQGTQIFRYKGKPGVETIPIGNDNLSQYENCFVLHVATGTTTETIVSSAIIKLDGLEVLNTSDFSKNGGEHTFEVCDITESSSITVEVRGKPGSYIEIWIEGKKKGLTVTDCDGNIYHTVKIGDQIWMAENLRTTRYRNCDLIGTTDPATLNTYYEISPKYQWAYDGNESNVATYGRLYTFHAVADERNLCPTGWHVADGNDILTLTNYLGDRSVAGGKMKEIGTSHWESPNIDASNESGFTALPGGYRTMYGEFTNIGYEGRWWQGPPVNYTQGYSYFISNDKSYLFGGIGAESFGFSVRCVKDN